MKRMIFIIAAFLSAGLVQISFKMVSAGEMNLFLCLLYGTAFLFAAICALKNKSIPNRKEILIGISLGASAMIQAYFWIKALQGLEGTVVYSTIGVGVILFVSIVSALFFKEKLSARGLLGICFGIAAIIMLVT